MGRDNPLRQIPRLYGKVQSVRPARWMSHAPPMIGEAPSEVVPVRLDPALRQAVAARAQAERTTASDIIRQALRKFVDVAGARGGADDR